MSGGPVPSGLTSDAAPRDASARLSCRGSARHQEDSNDRRTGLLGSPARRSFVPRGVQVQSSRRAGVYRPVLGGVLTRRGGGWKDPGKDLAAPGGAGAGGALVGLVEGVEELEDGAPLRGEGTTVNG